MAVKVVLTLRRLSLFIWETTLGYRRIPDQSTEPYPLANGEQTSHARDPVRFRTFHYKCQQNFQKNNKKKQHQIKRYYKDTNVDLSKVFCLVEVSPVICNTTPLVVYNATPWNIIGKQLKYQATVLA